MENRTRSVERRLLVHSSLDQFRQAAIGNGLRQCELFTGFPAAALEKICAFTSVRSLDTGSVLFHEQTPVCGFFIVQQGAIKLHRVTSWGQEHVIHIFRPHEPLAEETLVSESGYLATASATESSQVFAVEKAGFLALLRSYPELSLNLLRALSAQVELLVTRLDELSLKDVPTRLVDWLLQHCPDPESHQPQTVHVPGSKQLLASELGTSGETLSRTLAKFRDRHLLHVHGRAVDLLCPARLAQSVHGHVETTPLPSSRQRATTIIASSHHQEKLPCRSPEARARSFARVRPLVNSA